MRTTANAHVYAEDGFEIICQDITQWLAIGGSGGIALFMDDAKLAELRDVIDAHLSLAKQEAA